MSYLQPSNSFLNFSLLFRFSILQPIKQRQLLWQSTANVNPMNILFPQIQPNNQPSNDIIVYMQSNLADHGNPVSAAHFSPDARHSENNQDSPPPSNQRYQQPARINADDQSKCLLCLYAGVFLLPLIVCIIISALVLPYATKALNPVESLRGTNLENCTGFLQRGSLTTNTLSCYNRTAFLAGIFVKLFSNLNQFMLFYVDLSPYANKTTATTFNQTIIFTVYAAQYSQATKNTTVIGKLHSSNITFSTATSRLRQAQYFLGYQSKIAAGQQFFVEVGFQNSSAITSPSMFAVHVVTVAQNFTIYTILLRVAFFIVSLVVLAAYSSQLLKLPKKKVSIQQRLVQMMGGLTLLFNDQLYFVTVLWPNPISSFLSALFIWTFLFGLYFLWVSFLVRILYDEADTSTVMLRQGCRIILLVLFYVIGLTFCAGYAIIQVGDYPMISVNAVAQTWFRIYLSFVLFCFVIALIYLFYLYVEICRKRTFRMYRHNVFMFASLLFTTTIIILTLMGSFEVFNFSAGLVFFFFAFNNCYSYLLQYLYSPTKEQVQNIDEQSGGQAEVVSQSKTTIIQLSQAEEGKRQFELNYSEDSQKPQNKSQKSIRKRKREARSHAFIKNEATNGQSHDSIVREQEAINKNNKEEIKIEQQYDI